MSRTVVLLGFTSLFTDISSEMVAASLPIYLVAIRGLDPLQFGIIDGIYQGGSAIVRIVFGFFADRWRRYRDVAATGYGLSAASKLGLVLVGSGWTPIAGLIFADRTGKGIRTAPRDAMISMSSRPETLGVSFGLHRAMDTCGAMLGPLVAFALLALSPEGFRSLFFVSFCFALVGLAILLLLVNEPRHPAEPPASIGETAPVQVTVREAGRLVVTRRFGGLVGVAALLGLVTVSDAFIYLQLDREIDLGTSIFPLLFGGTALVFMTLAVPVGRLADRVGRRAVFLGGYLLLLALYLLLQTATPGVVLLAGSLLVLGAFYAATDGVLAALGSEFSPEALRGTGLAVLGTATGVARFFASVGFGALWTFAGAGTALVCFTAGLVVAIPIAALVLRPVRGAVA